MDGRAEEAAEAVGDKVRRILARHHALAQMQVAEFGDPMEDLGRGLRAGNHFHQVQIARRIEEVRAQKMLAKFGAEAFGDAG